MPGFEVADAPGMPSVDTLIWLAFGLGVPAALVVHYVGNARRSGAMRRLAQEIGFEFEAEDASLERRPWITLPIFSIGSDRRFLHVLRGSISGRQALLFDYRHRVGGLMTAMTHRSLVADLAIGIEKNRKPMWYDMTVAVFRAPKAVEPRRERVPGLPGGHTRIERNGEWLALYRFDRRVPVDEVRAFLQHATSSVERAETEND